MVFRYVRKRKNNNYSTAYTFLEEGGEKVRQRRSFEAFRKKGVKKKEAQTWFNYKARDIVVIHRCERKKSFPFPFPTIEDAKIVMKTNKMHKEGNNRRRHFKKPPKIRIESEVRETT